MVSHKFNLTVVVSKNEQYPTKEMKQALAEMFNIHWDCSLPVGGGYFSIREPARGSQLFANYIVRVA